ncbi:uncharacterized protein LOC111085921 [Limulus polyphemus]|uniref:Uncharacterized protein LOC111085921 n=1 Tax=Limulus polyphemus TaxID=6850 RepID=A0ABM1SFR7_LIMPO|nr:uncharacterized protein LOC111085921 [Limulus polyphemus]
MMYFGKRSEEETRPDHHMMYFGKRSEEEEKRPDHKATHFEKKTVNKVNDRLRSWPGDLVGNNYETGDHNMIYFGKRTQIYDNQENPVSSLLNLYGYTTSPISKKYGLNYYGATNPVLSFSYSQDPLFHEMNQPSLFPGNVAGEAKQESDETVMIPLVIKSVPGEKTEESKSSMTNHFERRSLKNEETKGTHSIKNYDSEMLSSKQKKSSIYSSRFSFKNKIKPKLNSKNSQKSMGHNRVKRSISASDEPVSDVAEDFAPYSGYEIIADNQDEIPVSKRWSFENPDLFSFHSVETLEPVITEQFQNRYPSSQYYFREDRDTNRKDGERNAFLHFG